MLETGNKNFWKLQILGWSIMAISNFLVQMTADFPIHLLLINSLGPFICGLVVTSLYRFMIKQYAWKNWSLSTILLLVIGSTLLMTAAMIALLTVLLRLIGQTAFTSTAALLSNFFVFGVLMLAWNLIYFSVHYFNHWHQSKIEKWQLLAEMKEAQLGALRSQINPHFIFNALNNIRSLILEDKDRAREMLLNFSDLFRYSLKHNEHSTVTLAEELTIIRQYLELLSIQFEDKLQYKIAIEDQYLDLQIPPMMLQLLVENAVKHGISQHQEGGKLTLEIIPHPDYLDIQLRNSGQLHPKNNLENQLGVGLENIKKRLQLLYNGRANFSLSAIDNWVIASIKIPLS